MSEPTPPAATSARRDWATPLIVLLTGAAIGGALYYTFGLQREVNRQFAATLREVQTAQTAATLAPGELAALQGLPAQLEAIGKSTAAANDQLTALSARLDGLEKSTQLLADTAHKNSGGAPNATDLRLFLALKSAIARGEPYAQPFEALSKSPAIALAIAPLADHAKSGVATDAALRAQLQNLLAAQTQSPAPDAATDAPPHSLTARLNAEFSGLLHISHHAATMPDRFTTVRAHLDAQSPLQLLMQDIETLSADVQKPFADWLSAAHARTRTDGILASLDAALGQQPGAP